MGFAGRSCGGRGGIGPGFLGSGLALMEHLGTFGHAQIGAEHEGQAPKRIAAHRLVAGQLERLTE